jgi:hypothetical protein
VTQPLGADDIPAMIAGAGGVPVVLGTDSTLGLVGSLPTEVLRAMGAGLRSSAEFVTVKSGTLPGLAKDAVITVDGVGHLVKDYWVFGDRALTHIEVYDKA